MMKERLYLAVVDRAEVHIENYTFINCSADDSLQVLPLSVSIELYLIKAALKLEEVL